VRGLRWKRDGAGGELPEQGGELDLPGLRRDGKELTNQDEPAHDAPPPCGASGVSDLDNGTT
jgi:hypothetical protein